VIVRKGGVICPGRTHQNQGATLKQSLKKNKKKKTYMKSTWYQENHNIYNSQNKSKKKNKKKLEKARKYSTL